jgi:hypothetical protein
MPRNVKIGGKTLAPGKYRVTITAKASNGATSQPDSGDPTVRR